MHTRGFSVHVQNRYSWTKGDMSRGTLICREHIFGGSSCCCLPVHYAAALVGCCACYFQRETGIVMIVKVEGGGSFSLQPIYS